VKNHKDLIDAEFAINEGGGGTMRKGKYLTNEVQASEKVFQDFTLSVTNAGGHSSLPVKDNAIYHLAAGLARLSAYDFPVELTRSDAHLLRPFRGRSSRIRSSPPTCAPWPNRRRISRPPRGCRRRCPLQLDDADDVHRDAAVRRPRQQRAAAARHRQRQLRILPASRRPR